MELSGYVYRCSAGETFDSIALTVYGNEKYACDLMNANPHLVRSWIFEGSEVLRLPVVEVMDDEDEEEYAPSTAPWREV